MTTTSNNNSGFSCVATGLFQVDRVERRNGNQYELHVQFATTVAGTPEDDPVNSGKALLWVEAPDQPPKVNAIIWGTGTSIEPDTVRACPFVDPISSFVATFIPHANAFFGLDDVAVLLEEDKIPEDFEPKPPTVIAIGRVVFTDQAKSFFKVLIEDYDRNVGRRSTHEIGVYRTGKRWDKAPWARDGAVVKVRGAYYTQNAVTSLHTINAASIDFLPWATAGAPDTPSPAKRRFVKGGLKRSAPDDDDAAEPSSPSTGRALRNSFVKGKGKAADEGA
ncbi:hypothetical protein OC861_004297 [Tilletia horrida]|nr:hypothetical protein OC861_004297 [Tilletia horrida]